MENSSYEPTLWEPGDVITAEKLQKIEDALEKHGQDIEKVNNNAILIKSTDTVTYQVPSYEEFQELQSKFGVNTKDINWNWTIGSLKTEDGTPQISTIRIRSCHIPVGKNTKIISSASGYRALYVFIYDTNWNFSEAVSWTNEWVAESDCWIRILVRNSNDATISNIETTSALLQCINYNTPLFKISESLDKYNFVMGDFGNNGTINSQGNTGLITWDILYAEKDLAIECNPNLYQVCVALFTKNHDFIAKSSSSGKGMICIPKGSYYRLRIKSFDTSETPTAPVLIEKFNIHEPIDGWWYGAQGGGDAHFYPRSSMLITPTIKFTNNGISAKCINGNYSVSCNEYSSEEPSANPILRHDWASEICVGPGCFYRLMIKWDNPSPISGTESVVSIQKALHQLVIEQAETINLNIATEGIAAKTTIDLGEVPNYYKQHIAAKAATINGLRYQHPGCTQFAFITDYHINGYNNNTGHSGALLKYLADNTMVDLCINGGDIASGLESWTQTDMTEYKALFRTLVREACAMTRPAGMIPLFIAGNHDGGISGGVSYEQLITSQELYINSGIQALRGGVTADLKCPLQYYWDDNIHNIRYIVGIIGLQNNVTGISDELAFKFIASALRTTPKNYGIIILNHIILKHPTENPTNGTVLLTNLADAYNERSENYVVSGNIDDNLVTYPSTKSDFSECAGRVLAIIGGHSHFDYSYITASGIPVIVTTTDNARGQFRMINGTSTSSPRPTSDIQEQAFDVFTIEPSTGAIWATRIGASNTDPAFYVNNEYIERSWNVPSNNS